MTQEIYEFLKQCPQFSDFCFNIDYLGKGENSLSLSGRGKKETIKKYTDGDSLEKVTYALRLRLPFGIDREVNAKNSLFLENLSLWFRKNNSKSNFPELGEKNIVVSVGFEVSERPETVTADTAVFKADLGIVYYKVK